MKIEKINDNQIKCTLTRSDLASRQLKLSEIAYGTEKANSLFRDMMDQANLEFGFDAGDIPIIIEAIPVSMDCIILMITKVEDPGDAGTRFSGLSSLKDLLSKELPELSDIPFGDDLSDSPAISQLFGNENIFAFRGTDCLYSFSELETVMELAREVRDFISCSNSLYKSAEDGRFYLFMSFSKDKQGEFAHINAIASEFGVNEAVSPSRAAYINEHFEKILENNALQSLAYV